MTRFVRGDHPGSTRILRESYASNELLTFIEMFKCYLFAVTGFLIANLAVADLGVGLLCIPFTVVYFELNFYWPFGPVMCKLLPALMPCFVMGSVGTMLAISVGKSWLCA